MEGMENYVAELEAARLALEAEEETKTTFTIRASSIPDLLDCPKRWYVRNQGLVERKTSLSAWIGTSFHKACAEIDEGEGHPISRYVENFMESVWTFPGDAAFKEDELKAYDLKPVATKLLEGYRDKVERLEFEFLAVEMRMTPLETHGLRLTGIADRVYKKKGKVGILDIKTGGRAVETSGFVNAVPHRPQLAVYKLMAESVFNMDEDAPCFIIGLNASKKATAARVGLGGTLVTKEYTNMLLDTVYEILSSQRFYGNPRSMLCNGKFCELYDICPWRTF